MPPDWSAVTSIIDQLSASVRWAETLEAPGK
jgi:hypothetical protein